MAATHEKNRAKNPPTAAKDTRRETMIVLTVAATKKSRKTNNPDSMRRAIVPTCGIDGYSEKTPTTPKGAKNIISRLAEICNSIYMPMIIIQFWESIKA